MPSVRPKSGVRDGVERGSVTVKVPANPAGPNIIKKPSPAGGGFTPAYAGTVVGSSNALSSKERGTTAAKKGQNIDVAVWCLQNTSSKAPETFEAVLSTNGPPRAETVFEGDDRKKVNPRDFGPGGKYRSVVKLFLVFHDPSTEEPRTLIATGWLIAPDLIVSAGHCVFDWEHNLNQVTEIKAYIGYDGRASVGSPDVQFRKGVKVATTTEWMKSGEPHHDVSFIKVQKPFNGVRPFKYADTPLAGNMALGVVGYPGDLHRGEHMYECFMDVKFNVIRDKMMLQYKIDTYGGNSGGPVIRASDNVPIGVHVMGGKVNQATLIGKQGNMFPAFVWALSMSDKKMPQGPLQISWLQLTPAQPGEAGLDFEADMNVEAVDYDRISETEPKFPDPSSEAYTFNRIMIRGKSFSQNFSQRLSDVGLPASLGLSGKLAAIYAHALCHSMYARNPKFGRRAALREGRKGEAGTEASESLDGGSLGRAVLSEAALDTLFSLDKSTIGRLKIWDLMARHATRTSQRVEGFWNFKPKRGGTIGAQLANAAISTATGALISGISGLFRESSGEGQDAASKPAEADGENDDHDDGEDGDEPGQGGDGADANPRGKDKDEVPPTTATATGRPAKDNGATDNMPKVKRNMQAFIQKLLRSAKPGSDSADKLLVSLLQESAETESLAESMPQLVESLAPPPDGRDGPGTHESAEADEAEEDAAAEADEVYQGLKARLILGDAALETLLELTVATDPSESVASSETTTTESFLGKVWSRVKKIAKVALKAVPGVIVSAASNALLKKMTEAMEAGGGTGPDQSGGPTTGGNGDETGGGMDGNDDDEAEEDAEHEAMDSFGHWMNDHSNPT